MLEQQHPRNSEAPTAATVRGPKDQQRQRRHSACARLAPQATAVATQARHDAKPLALAGAPLTMSSREIAELVESRHDSVKLTIERLSTRGVIALPPLVEVPSAGPGPRLVGVYHLGKRDSYVVVAQLSPEFTGRLVDRWQELEAQRHHAVEVPRTFAEALRLAADQAEQLDGQRLQIEAQRPAVEFVERFVDSTGTLGVRQVAKLLKANERDFVAWLEARGIMYRLAGHLTPMARHMDAGRFEVKTGSADNGHAYAAAHLTPKGVQWIAGEWGKHTASASMGAH